MCLTVEARILAKRFRDLTSVVAQEYVAFREVSIEKYFCIAEVLFYRHKQEDNAYMHTGKNTYIHA